jgi:Trk K+ transport system NAD-binding subunit
MAAQVARHIFHVHEVLCRISDPQRGRFYKELGIDVVCPTLVLTDTINKALKDAS